MNIAANRGGGGVGSIHISFNSILSCTLKTIKFVGGNRHNHADNKLERKLPLCGMSLFLYIQRVSNALKHILNHELYKYVIIGDNVTLLIRGTSFGYLYIKKICPNLFYKPVTIRGISLFSIFNCNCDIARLAS